jgi:hypothetical protein
VYCVIARLAASTHSDNTTRIHPCIQEPTVNHASAHSVATTRSNNIYMILHFTNNNHQKSLPLQSYRLSISTHRDRHPLLARSATINKTFRRHRATPPVRTRAVITHPQHLITALKYSRSQFESYPSNRHRDALRPSPSAKKRRGPPSHSPTCTTGSQKPSYQT